MRIAILGYSGSGKSTLANSLSVHYDIPVLYLDTVQFEAGWKERDRKEAVFVVSEFMKHENWVIDGNYVTFLQKERLELADSIIYMAFSRFDCLLRAWQRFRKYRNLTRESMADGCEEKMDMEFVWWILFKGRSRKKKRYYKDILMKYSEKAVILKNQKELDWFIHLKFQKQLF